MDKVTQGSGRPEDREAGLPRRDATDEEVGFEWVGSKSGFSRRGELTTKLSLSGPMAHTLSIWVPMFVLQLTWDPGCPDIWPNIILGVLCEGVSG